MYTYVLRIPLFHLHSYHSLTCHFVTAEFERVQVFLHAVSFDNSHTGDQIASTLINCLQAWGIFDALHVGVCDNGSNFVAGLRNSAFPTYLAWTTHVNLLSMMAVYIAQPSVTLLTAKAISYRQSNLACKALHRIQEQLFISSLRMNQPVGMHVLCLTGFLNKDMQAITAANVELDVPVELRSADWVLAEKVVKILKVFEEATREASGSNAT